MPWSKISKRRNDALKEMKFEDAMIKLEGAVKRLESGNMPLDESIATFEEAVKLISVCNRELNKAEQKVRMLVESSDGSITDVPFDVNDET